MHTNLMIRFPLTALINNHYSYKKKQLAQNTRSVHKSSLENQQKLKTFSKFVIATSPIKHCILNIRLHIQDQRIFHFKYVQWCSQIFRTVLDYLADDKQSFTSILQLLSDKLAVFALTFYWSYNFCPDLHITFNETGRQPSFFKLSSFFTNNLSTIP